MKVCISEFVYFYNKIINIFIGSLVIMYIELEE